MAKRTAVKSGPNFTLYDDGLLKIENVRLSFVHLDKPYAGKNDSEKKESVPKYSVTPMLPKGSHKEAQAAILGEINRLCAEKKWMRDGKRTIPKDKLCIRNGDDEGQREEYAGHWTLSARELKRPILRDRRNMNVEAGQINDVFYSGCYGTVCVDFWAQDNSFGKRVNCSLRIVQFVKDGEAFGAGRMTDNDADDVLDAAADDGITAPDDDEDDL